MKTVEGKGSELFTMKPIGWIQTCFKDKFGTPRQSGLVKESTAKLSLRRDLQPEQALEGLEGFSHLWLIWIFHQNEVARYHAKVHPPRFGGDSLGLFATRSPHRPNPIGLSLVELVGIEKETLFLKGVDLVDGTPILDIKPYLRETESLERTRQGWTENIVTNPIQVDITFETQQFLLSYCQNLAPRDQSIKNQNDYERIEFPQLLSIIKETLSLDPRPRVYKSKETGLSQHRELHYVRLYDLDIQFRFVEAHRILVDQIKIIV